MLKGTDNQRKASAIWVVGELELDELLEDVVYALYSENYQVHSIANRVLKIFKEMKEILLFLQLALIKMSIQVDYVIFKELMTMNHPEEFLMLQLQEPERNNTLLLP